MQTNADTHRFLCDQDGKVWLVHLKGSNTLLCMSRFSSQGFKQINNPNTTVHHKERNEYIEANDVSRLFVNAMKRDMSANHPNLIPFNAPEVWGEKEKEKRVLDVPVSWCLRCWKTTCTDQGTRTGCCKLSSVRCVGIAAKVGGKFAPFPTTLPTDASVSN